MKNAVAGLDPTAVTDLLRTGALAIKPEDIGLPRAECPQVWGVILELGYPTVVATLVVLLDGSVSVYLSNGGGVIGCGLHPEVRNAARILLQRSQNMAAFCQPTQLFPKPADDLVFFYLLTPQGVCTAQANRGQLDDGEIELAELYYAMLSLVDIVELLGAGVDLVDEMRLAECKFKQDQGASNDVSGAVQMTANELQARGRACRILPYAGSAARRSRN